MSCCILVYLNVKSFYFNTGNIVVLPWSTIYKYVFKWEPCVGRWHERWGVYCKPVLQKEKFIVVEHSTDCQVSHLFDYSRLMSTLTRTKEVIVHLCCNDSSSCSVWLHISISLLSGCYWGRCNYTSSTDLPANSDWHLTVSVIITSWWWSNSTSKIGLKMDLVLFDTTKLNLYTTEQNVSTSSQWNIHIVIC